MMTGPDRGRLGLGRPKTKMSADASVQCNAAGHRTLSAVDEPSTTVGVQMCIYTFRLFFLWVRAVKKESLLKHVKR
jgi:hypothetical protein